MTFKKPSKNSLTSWRTKRYRESLTAKEEDKLWEIIEDYINGAVLKPRAQLRFFKAIEQFTKQVHIERVRWKEQKDAKVAPIVETVVNEAFKRWDVTIVELRRKTRAPHTPEKIYKARKFIVTELRKKLSHYRIAKLLGIARKSSYNWSEYDVDCSE